MGGKDPGKGLGWEEGGHLGAACAWAKRTIEAYGLASLPDSVRRLAQVGPLSQAVGAQHDRGIPSVATKHGSVTELVRMGIVLL